MFELDFCSLEWRAFLNRSIVLQECTDAEVATYQLSGCSLLNCSPPICAGCGNAVSSRVCLESSRKRWHTWCLRCSECNTSLEDEHTCFVRQGKTYCRADYLRYLKATLCCMYVPYNKFTIACITYFRLFVRKCNGCQEPLLPSDLVMRAKDLIYHLGCFKCNICQRKFDRGDLCCTRNGHVYCETDYEIILNGTGKNKRRRSQQVSSRSFNVGVFRVTARRDAHSSCGACLGNRIMVFIKTSHIY